MRRAAPLPHPCLPVPAAERRRLATAAHLALAAMLADRPAAEWGDLPAAVAVAAEALVRLETSDEVLQAVERAAAALVATAGLSTPTDEAKAACQEFLQTYEALLATVTWRRLIHAQRCTAEAWQACARAASTAAA